MKHGIRCNLLLCIKIHTFRNREFSTFAERCFANLFKSKIVVGSVPPVASGGSEEVNRNSALSGYY